MSGTIPADVETNSDFLPTNASLEEKLVESQRKAAVSSSVKLLCLVQVLIFSKSLTRSLQAKSKTIREGLCFNTTITASNLRKEKAQLLGHFKQLKDSKDAKDTSLKKKGLRISELEDEVKRMRKINGTLKITADNKDRKISKLKDIINELRSGSSGKK